MASIDTLYDFVNIALCCTIFEIIDIKEYLNLENVKGSLTLRIYARSVHR